MKRDFSESARQQLLALVKQVENEKWCDFTDWVGDRWYDFQEWIGNLDIKNYIDNVNAYHKKIIDKNNTTVGQINTIFENVNIESNVYKNKVECILTNLEEFDKLIKKMTETIDPQKGLFNSEFIGNGLVNATDSYIEKSKLLRKKVIENLPSINPSFDEDGSYGGNQGSAMNVYKDEDIQNIVKEYYPDYSDKEIKEFLQKLNGEGCGYVALCNTVFEEYIGREEEFEETFGFPMYKNGDLNYDALIVDLYCSEDIEDIKGMNTGMMKLIWEDYLRKHGVEVDVVNSIELTLDNYHEIEEEGQIIVAIEPCILENEKGDVVYDSEGGHAMTVTGITEDGRYIVSSWGRKYYIDPDSDYKGLQFQQVRYK